MNDQPSTEQIEQFNRALESGSDSALDPETRQIVDTLSQNHVSLSRSRTTTRDRLVNGGTMRAPRFNWSVATGFALMVITVIGLFVVMSPQSEFAPAAGITSEMEQAAAESSLALTGNVLGTFGGCPITDGPTQGQRVAGGEPYPTLDPNLGASQFAPDAASAEALAGFDVWFAQSLPGGRELMGVTVIATNQATQVYAVALDDYGAYDRNGVITLRQMVIGATPCDCAIGSTPLVSTTVNGAAGYWLEDLPTLFIDGAIVNQDELWWEAGGYSFILSGDQMTLEEALAIAESVTP